MSAENALEKRDKLLMDSFNRIENKMRLVGATGEKSMNWLLQGVFFSFWTPPKFSKYKIPLYALSLREILGQFTWDLVLRKLRGGLERKKALYVTRNYYLVQYEFLEAFKIVIIMGFECD